MRIWTFLLAGRSSSGFLEADESLIGPTEQGARCTFRKSHNALPREVRTKALKGHEVQRLRCYHPRQLRQLLQIGRTQQPDEVYGPCPDVARRGLRTRAATCR